MVKKYCSISTQCLYIHNSFPVTLKTIGITWFTKSYGDSNSFIALYCLLKS